VVQNVLTVNISRGEMHVRYDTVYLTCSKKLTCSCVLVILLSSCATCNAQLTAALSDKLRVDADQHQMTLVHFHWWSAADIQATSPHFDNSSTSFSVSAHRYITQTTMLMPR